MTVKDSTRGTDELKVPVASHPDFAQVLSRRLSNTGTPHSALETLEWFETSEILNTDLSPDRIDDLLTSDGSQFTSAVFTRRLVASGVRISMDRLGRWMDNVLFRRLQRPLKSEGGVGQKKELTKPHQEKAATGPGSAARLISSLRVFIRPSRLSS